jgi:alanine racemase
MRGTYISICQKSLIHNIQIIQNKIGINHNLIAVVKANAYGHGIEIVSKVLRNENIKMLAVAFYSEALQLRELGDTGDILLLVPTPENKMQGILDNNLHFTCVDLEFLKKIGKLALEQNKIAKAHLFIDTGMHRDGIYPEDALNFLENAKQIEGVEIVGIMSHLAASESPESELTINQKKQFSNLVSELSNLFHFEYIHLYNSCGIFLEDQNTKSYSHKLNSFRPGISLHGLLNSKEESDKQYLKPTLKLSSQVLYSKSIKAGDYVSYSFRYQANKDTNIALVPIGYGDGLAWSMTNKLECLINNKRYKVIGSICMDQIMVDIEDDFYEAGTEVIMIGKQGNDEITVYDWSQWSNSMPYEVVTRLMQRLPRKLV